VLLWRVIIALVGLLEFTYLMSYEYDNNYALCTAGVVVDWMFSSSYNIAVVRTCLQFFDTVGWASGRASGL